MQNGLPSGSPNIIDNEQGGFRAGRGYVDQICKKARKKKRRMYVSFVDLDKAYEGVNREALWQVLRMYDVYGQL